MAEFEVGDRVEKCTGDYRLEGIVVAAFVTVDGKSVTWSSIGR